MSLSPSLAPSVQGCVPVITDLDYVLPFSEVLDWTLASVTCWSHDLAGVGSLLESLSEDTVRRLQEQVCAI